jgi:hypothetical protein
MSKTTLEPIDGSRSRLTGETAVAVEAPAPRKTAKTKKDVPSEADAELAAAFEVPIGTVIDRGEKTVKENLEMLVERINKIKANRVEWDNLSHVQRVMLSGALYAAREALGEKDNGVAVSFARFLGITFK